MVEKAYILAEIKRTAKANGGTSLGWRRFASETGVAERDWLRHWPRWGDAVAEAGFAPNTMQGAYPDERLAASLADEARRLGRFPTVRELHLRHLAEPTFPDAKVFTNRWGKRERIEAVDAHARAHPELGDLLSITEPLLTEPVVAPRRAPRSPAPVVIGEVYLLRMGRYHKVGRSNSAGRREYELAIQMPERVTRVHVIKTDDPPGIEAYWHRRFAGRRRNGEWFELTREDIDAFKRRKFM